MAAPARRIESVSTAELYDRWAEVWGTLSTNFDINFYFELLSVPCHIIYRVWNSCTFHQERKDSKSTLKHG